MSPWIFIILSSGCSVAVAHLLKLVEFKQLNTIRVLTVNYLIATFIAFLHPGNSYDYIDLTLTSPVIILAIIVGILFIANFFIYSKSVYKNGVGISVASMRLSLIIPVLLSTFWYHEYLDEREWVGILFVFIALILLLPDKKSLFKKPYNAGWLLILLFFFTGLGDSSLKVYESDFSDLLIKEHFMGFIFLSAFLTGFCMITIRKMWGFKREEIVLGIVIGIPNLYSAIFLIEALSYLSGGIVYTAANLLTVMGATFLGVWWWGDRLTKFQWLGIGLTLISIILLV
jgi:drug/metabolite transporter (DMT)-like permease